jgi:dTDP-4-dehydrorhamnose 3,5-epimerase-like enzyme
VPGTATTIDDCRLLPLRKIVDARGNLTPLEGEQDVPFLIRRVYWIYDVPGGEVRGGHAYHELEELVVALSGSFDFVVDDGRQRKAVTLNRAFQGLYVPRMIWRSVESFSTNAACLIMASLPYDPADYIRDYDRYRSLKEQAP